MATLLLECFIYLTAAVIAVPLATRFGLGSVLGYLIAGIAIGPVFGLVGSETQDIQHFAEFGVVMMLFIVGLELDPRTLWDMRARLLGLGGLQVGITVAIVMGGGILFGLQWSVALAVGLILALSSTAIVLQTLGEKGLMQTGGGRSGFSVLLFQDIAVIPMLALIPLLALPELMAGHGGEDGHHEESMSLVEGLPGWGIALVNASAIIGVVAVGYFLLPYLFRFIAAARLREVFTAAALLIVIGIALLMTLVGLSPALGTFLAGVVLANSEFRHELEADIEPFKGLLLGLFFITVGAGIDFILLYNAIFMIVGLTLALIAVKLVVLYALALVFRLGRQDRWLFAFSLAQAGEFGFVLASFSLQNGVIPPDLSRILSLIIALSMLLTPVLFILYDKVIAARENATEIEADEITEKGTVIVAGLGRFGQIVNRILLANGHKTVVLDHRPDLINSMRKFGVKSFYGDATRADLLEAAGLQDAVMLVIAIEDPDRAIHLAQYARAERPDIHIVARAHDRLSVYRLFQAGANDIVRETFDSAVRAGRSALEGLGMHPFDAEKAATVFTEHDKETLRNLAALWDPDIPVAENEAYVAAARERNLEMERAILGDRNELHDRSERGWTPPPKGSRTEA